MSNREQYRGFDYLPLFNAQGYWCEISRYGYFKCVTPGMKTTMLEAVKSAKGIIDLLSKEHFLLNAPTAFNELFDNHAIKWQSEKVRYNSRNDYGLPPYFVFSYGNYATNNKGENEFRTLWVSPSTNLTGLLTPRMFNGLVGSIRLIPTDVNKVRAVANDALHIAQVVVCDEVTDIPQEVKQLLCTN